MLRPSLAAIVLALALAADASAVIRFDSQYFMQHAVATESGYESSSFSLGDVNGDGILDAISYASFMKLVVSLGVGDGTFRAPVSISAPNDMRHGVVADFDADGALDIGFTNWGSSGVMFGDGTGIGWTSVTMPSEMGSAAVAGDFDGDGQIDLVALVADSDSGSVQCFLSRPGRTFQTVTQSYREMRGPLLIAATADINLDGHTDVVVVVRSGDGWLIVLEGRGDGSFDLEPMSIDWLNIQDLDLADGSGDGVPDLAIAAYPEVKFLRGAGTGTFSVEHLPNPQSWHRTCRFADVTEDGIVDLVSTRTQGIVTWPGLGNGQFGALISTPLEGIVTSIRMADLDQDGHLDVVAMGEMGGVISMLGHGDGTFGTPTSSVPSDDAHVLSGDMDEDGDDDVIVTKWDGTTKVLLSDSFRVITSMPTLAMNAGFVEKTALADFDGDGHLDVLMKRDSSRVRILRGHGDGTLSILGDQSAGPSVWVGECTADVHLDLLFGSGSSIAVLPGRGDGSFDPAVVIPVGAPVVALAIGQLNSDDLPDLSLITSSGWLQSSWLRAIGTGSGSFSVETLEAGDRVLSEVLIHDVNGDGADDVLATDLGPMPMAALMEGTLRCRLQQPSGSLAPAIESPWAALSWGTRLRDVNDDGFVDLITILQSGFMIFVGDGSGHFMAEGGYRWYGGSWDPGDFDADGATDVAQTSGSELVITYGRRDREPPSIAFTMPGPPFTMSPGQGVSIPWQASDVHFVASIDLFVSRHGAGGPFERIALGLTNTGEYSWTVTSPLSDSVVFNAVARDSAGNVGRATTSGLRSIVTPVSVGEPDVPAALALGSISPNPARGRLSVSFALPAAGRVRLVLYDVRGREVARMLDRDHAAGRHVIEWARHARPLAPGLYFLELRSGIQRATARVTLLN